jgi:PAS domain S-box-containing protein
MKAGGVSLQRRLRSLMMLTTTTVLLLASGASAIVDYLSFGAITARDLKTLASVMALNSTASLTFHDRESAHEVLQSLKAKPSIIAAAIFDIQGRSFQTYSKKGEKIFVPVSLQRVKASPSAGSTELFTDVIFDGEKIGTLYIAASHDMMIARIKQSALTLLCILAMALAVAYFLSSTMQRIISSPIHELAVAAQEVTRNDNYSVRVGSMPDTVPKEINNLVSAFNQMLSEIERRDEELQRHRDDLEGQVQSRTAELERVAEAHAVLARRKQLILNSAAEGIVGLDRHGLPIFVNASAQKMLGRRSEELLGRRLHDLIHPEAVRNLPAANCLVCSATLDPVVRTGSRETFVRTDGSEFPVEYTAAVTVDSAGERSGVVITFRDVTERLMIDRMKDEFVSTVSHELRTPLTSIRGALGLLASGLIGNVDPRAQRMLDIAVSNTDRLVRLINDILDLERIDSGHVELNRGVIDSGDLLTEAVDGIQSFADRAGVQIVCDIAHEKLWGDHDRIIQALTNLVSNAVKFSEGGKKVRVSGSRSGGMFTFVVEDQGRGIPATHLESIFERFKQVDASDSRNKGGTGLGLAICRSIVTAHGGKIWVESTEGKGTTFSFTIPMHEEAMPEPASFPTVVAFADPTLVGTIRRGAFRVEVAETIADLGALAVSAHADVVLIDLTLPGWSWEFVQKLKANPLTHAVPIVVAATTAEPAFKHYAELIASWIPKAASDSDVTRVLTAVCERPSVLIVEDDLDLARVISASLEEHGIRTRHAVNGRFAAAACEEEVPSAMILDLALPEMDGYQVVQWMRARQKLAHVPLIVYTAHEVSPADQERLRLGPTEFMTKSRVSPEQFEQRVVELLETMTTAQEVEGAA